MVDRYEVKWVNRYKHSRLFVVWKPVVTNRRSYSLMFNVQNLNVHASLHIVWYCLISQSNFSYWLFVLTFISYSSVNGDVTLTPSLTKRIWIGTVFMTSWQSMIIFVLCLQYKDLVKVHLYDDIHFLCSEYVK